MNIFEIILVRPIFNLLLFFYNLVGDFGLAIVLFVIVLRFIMFPLLKTQYNQTRRIRKLQPELAKIRRKYKDNPQRQLLMQSMLYKQNGVKASRTFLTTLIQLPVIIAMYQVISLFLQSAEAITKYGYGIIKNLPNINEIINGTRQFQASLFGIDLTELPMSLNTLNSWILLVILILMAWSQYYITKMMTPAPTDSNGKKRRLKDIFSEAANGKEPDQAEMSQVMSGSMNKIMPIMFFFTFGWFYGALSFYYLITNLITIAQYKYLEREYLPDVNEVKDNEIANRLQKSQVGKIVGNIKSKKSESNISTVYKSGQHITRIKAKK